MNSEQKLLEEVLQYFLKNHCDDPINGTKLNCAVIDTIRKLQRQYADSPAKDYQMTTEEKELGFVIKEGSGILGCCTIPCSGGKMPYQSEPIVGCAIGGTMCDQSPIQVMRESKAFEKADVELKEEKRLAKNKNSKAKICHEKRCE